MLRRFTFFFCPSFSHVLSNTYKRKISADKQTKTPTQPEKASQAIYQTEPCGQETTEDKGPAAAAARRPSQQPQGTRLPFGATVPSIWTPTTPTLNATAVTSALAPTCLPCDEHEIRNLSQSENSDVRTTFNKLKGFIPLSAFPSFPAVRGRALLRTRISQV